MVAWVVATLAIQAAIDAIVALAIGTVVVAAVALGLAEWAEDGALARADDDFHGGVLDADGCEL